MRNFAIALCAASAFLASAAQAGSTKPGPAESSKPDLTLAQTVSKPAPLAAYEHIELNSMVNDPMDILAGFASLADKIDVKRSVSKPDTDFIIFWKWQRESSRSGVTVQETAILLIFVRDEKVAAMKCDYLKETPSEINGEILSKSTAEFAAAAEAKSK